jgi:hypothetical protein
VGVAGVYNDPALLAQALQSLNPILEYQLPLLAQGGLLYLRDVQNLPWGMIEYAPSAYNFTVSDLIIQAAQANGLHYIGTVMPYAAWDLAALDPSQDEMCQRLMTQDFYYLASGGKMGRYQNLAAFITWLGMVVERYDGDGVDDMPGLQYGLRFWQIHNEPEGDRCGGFRQDPAAFVELLRQAYTTIHASCAACVVMNGGAGIPLWRENQIQGGTFWREVAELGGGQYLDILAIHYNDGKHGGADPANLATQITRMQALFGADKPVWVTEFGVLIEDAQMTPGSGGSPGGFERLPENAAAAWYIRYYTVGLAYGAERFFSDVVSFVSMQRQIRLPYYINKLLEAKIGAFSAVRILAAGQYAFTVDGQSVYVLWEGVPADLSGNVKVTDMYGNETVMDAAALQPHADSPVLVEKLP